MSNLSEALTKVLGGSRALALEEKAPHLLFGAGVVGFGATVVVSCRATLKLDNVLIKAQRDLERINKGVEELPDVYSEQDRVKDVATVYVRTTVAVAHLYAPAILIGSASIAALTKSHDILSKRNAALTAAYAAVNTAFNEYRERVVDKYGDDIDRELRYGVEEVEVLNEKTGKKKKIKQISPGEPSMYARFFDSGSISWSKDPEVNYVFVRANQRYANDLLLSRGHVFLNEVYDMLGLKRSTAGSIVGWVMDPEHSGDNYIDFGLFSEDGLVRDFMNGHEGSVLLDFNVDGPIFDKIGDGRESLSWQKN